MGLGHSFHFLREYFTLRQQEVLISTFTNIDCRLVMFSKHFSLCFLIPILVIKTHLCQGFMGSLYKNILYDYKHVPPQFIDKEIDNLSTVVPGGVC